VVSPIWDGGDDLPHSRAPLKDWTEKVMAGTTLGPGVHFLTVLLVLENYCHVAGKTEKIRVGEREDTAGPGPKDDAPHADTFGAARLRSFCVLTGAHCEEKGFQDEVSGVVVSGWPAVFGPAGQKVKELPKKL
jgi:hypothetical protein